MERMYKHKKRNNKALEFIIFTIFIISILLLFPIKARAEEKENISNTIKSSSESSSEELEFNSFKELEGRTFATSKGSVMEEMVPKKIKGMKPLIFNSNTDCLAAVEAGKADVLFCSEPYAIYWSNLNVELGVLREKLEDDDIAFAFANGSSLKEKFDKCIDKYKVEGKLDELADKWFKADETKKDFDNTTGSGRNGTIRVFCTSNTPPMDYIGKTNEMAGYEIELLYMISRDLDMKLKITKADFDGLIAAVQSGKCDVVSGCITITKERDELVDFSKKTYEGGIIGLVKKKNFQGENGDILASIKASFEKAFIVENRWKMILDGLGVTLVISIASAIFGIIFGFILCMIRRSKIKVIPGLIAFLIRIIQGTPIVVVLMILYYIVFGNTDVSGIIISILGFSINFAAYSAEIMRSGINAVDSGQREAALALGLTPIQGFFRVVFPQAATHFIPVLKGEFISMVKMTSVVGYIAVEDLTKISDIIRSRTMDAFFPLVATAIIYFILANILILIISFFEKKIDIKKRPRKVKL